MRTRLLDALTNDEITAYLRHNDLIYLPLGAVEMQGAMPVGSEYVLPLACGLEFAEQTDGLVLPHLAYFFSGATAIGRGTVSVSPSAGAAYLKEISHSLCRQGFRRQVFVSAHAPAQATVSSVVREAFQETGCVALHLDLLSYVEPSVDFNLLFWGAYEYLGRLSDIPTDQKPTVQAPPPEAVHKMQRPGVQFGFYYSDETQHGWWPAEPVTAEQREARAQEGLLQLHAMVNAVDAKTLVEGIRELDKYVQHHVRPKYETRLP